MKKIYAEIGLGNENFFSTEIEEGNKETRKKGLIMPKKLEEIYFRIWIIRRVLVVSFFKGIALRKKPKTKFKLILGFGGSDNGD